MPKPLAELLESNQALEVIPGVLYFASIGERLPNIDENLSQSGYSSTGCHKRCTSREEEIETAAATAAFDASLRDSVAAVERQVSEGQHAETLDSPKCVKISHCRRSSAVQNAILQRHLLQVDECSSSCCCVFENDVLYFSLGESASIRYRPFFADFGPLGLDCITRVCRYLEVLLGQCALYTWDTSLSGDGEVFGPTDSAPESFWHEVATLKNDQGGGDKFGMGRSTAAEGGNVPVVFCSGLGNHERANVACLAACFCVATLRWTAAQTWHIFQRAFPPIMSFRDASYGASSFPLMLPDILGGLQRAIKLGWYNVRTFDLQTFDKLREYGCCWIIPQMFMTFSSPVGEDGERSALVYAKLFQNLHVTKVMRLNKPLYNRDVFLKNGIDHVDLEFADGSVPSDSVINRFMKEVNSLLHPDEAVQTKRGREKSPKRHVSSRCQSKKCQGRRRISSEGAIAVHCHAGLGRTGTMACIYIIQRYGFSAREVIGWIRLCRPGSVIGAQQMFLEKFEYRVLRQGRQHDFMRSQYHARVVGSGVVDRLSSYSYQLHKPRRSLSPYPSLAHSPYPGSSSTDTRSTCRSPLYGLAHTGVSNAGATPLDPAETVGSGNRAQSSHSSNMLRRLRPPETHTPSLESLLNPAGIAPRRAVMSTRSRAKCTDSSDRDEVLCLPDAKEFEVLSMATAAEGLPLPSARSCCLRKKVASPTPVRLQALVGLSKNCGSAGASSIKTVASRFTMASHRRRPLETEVLSLSSTMGSRGEDLVAVNAIARAALSAPGIQREFGRYTA
ncbi:putative tyrosine phosphatase [Trypanosoma vivax]|nr:putative tyrosine phosphatase [Trypanosoma vivax]